MSAQLHKKVQLSLEAKVQCLRQNSVCCCQSDCRWWSCACCLLCMNERQHQQSPLFSCKWVKVNGGLQITPIFKFYMLIFFFFLRNLRLCSVIPARTLKPAGVEINDIKHLATVIIFSWTRGGGFSWSNKTRNQTITQGLLLVSCTVVINDGIRFIYQWI